MIGSVDDHWLRLDRLVPGQTHLVQRIAAVSPYSL